MPESAPLQEPPPPAPDAGPARRGRSRIDRFSYQVVRRFNLAGLLLLAAAFCTVDFVVIDGPVWPSIMTGLEAALAIPWAWVVVTMDMAESRIGKSRSLGRLYRVATHAVTFAALASALLAKAIVVHNAASSSFAPFVGVYRNYVAFVFVLFVLGLLGRGSRFARLLGSLADHPARLMALSFAVVALLGGFLLTLPVSLQRVQEGDFVAGLFTATSAVCVTGLIVNDIASTYTAFGQAVIFVLIQAGGLGIMVLTASVAILAGRRLRTRSTATLAEMIDAESFAALRHTIRHIFIFTIVIEATGALVLYLAFKDVPEIGLGPESADPLAGAGSHVWSAVFHSVSAFCNAGFSLCHGNLIRFTGSVPVSGTIAFLITLGGLGFPVLDELWVRVKRRRSGLANRRLSFHSRLVLRTSAGLVMFGTLAYLLLEWNGTLHDLSWGDRLIAAVFQSVTTRTAGFNTLDYGAMAAPTLVITCMLMLVGASPGSTGGGVKTTTFAVLLAAFRAEILGSANPRLMDRSVPEATARRAVAVAVGSFGLITVVWFLLLMTEDIAPLRVLFEVVSAYATCGLSTGITAQLSDVGRVILTFVMFVGRIGPVTIALALVATRRTERFQLPAERVLIG